MIYEKYSSGVGWAVVMYFADYIQVLVALPTLRVVQKSNISPICEIADNNPFIYQGF